jgi:hypothetical protein
MKMEKNPNKPCRHPLCPDSGPCKKAKGTKKEAKVKRVLLTPLPKLLKETEALCNRYIRLRDAGKPCVSCGNYTTLQAGHYIAVKQSSFLRYDEFNIAGQCAQCNKWRYGNAIPYRIELRKRIGELELERLERDFIENKRHKWGRQELEEIKEYYRNKIADLEGKNQNSPVSALEPQKSPKRA